jgi:hypothetical protein
LEIQRPNHGSDPAQDPGPGKPKPGNGELETHKVNPKKGKTTKESLVPLGKERHHVSVLGEVSKRTKDGRSKQKLGSGLPHNQISSLSFFSLLSTNPVDNSSIWNLDHPSD